MQIETMKVETYAETIFEHLSDLTIEGVDGALFTSATHPERGELLVLQAFPCSTVTIVTSPAA